MKSYIASLSALFVASFVCPTPVDAFYFYLKDEKICFPYQNGPDQGTATVYTQVFADGEPKNAIKLTFWSPAARGAGEWNQVSSDIFLSLRQLESQDFVVHEEGWYRACVEYAPGKPANPQGLRMELNIEVKPDIDHRDPDTPVETYRQPINTLNSNIESAHREINYLLARTGRFSKTAQSTYWRVVWCAIINICVLIGSSWWQVWSLKRLFKEKKLV